MRSRASKKSKKACAMIANGTVVQLAVHFADRGKLDNTSILGVVVHSQPSDSDTVGHWHRVAVPSGLLSNTYADFELAAISAHAASVPGLSAAWDRWRELPVISQREAARFESWHGGQGKVYCKCRGMCARGRCKCMREGVPCTELCHKGHTCTNTPANRAAGHGKYTGKNPTKKARPSNTLPPTERPPKVQTPNPRTPKPRTPKPPKAPRHQGTTPPMSTTFPPVYLPKGEEGWDVDHIVAHRQLTKGRKRAVLEFLLRWEGYGSDDDSWEPSSNVHGSLIQDYYESGDAKQLQEE